MRIQEATGVGSSGDQGALPVSTRAGLLRSDRAHRRGFLLAGAALLATPHAASQANKVYRIGLLTARPQNPYRQVFEDGLREFGYVDGRNIAIVHRYADATGSFTEAAKSLVRENVDVIVTGVNPSTDAVRQATPTIPIVMLIGTNAIAAGYAQSLARPGGQVTGFLWDAGDAPFEKRLDLLKEAVPGLSRVAILWEPPYSVSRQRIESASSVLGLSLFTVQFAGDLERSFAEIVRSGADGLHVLDGTLVTKSRPELAAIALRHALPSMSTNAQSVDAGCLMSYAPSIAAVIRSAGRPIDKILRGIPPGDIPIEQPTRLELVINLRTARALGLAVPRTVLLRAERLIE